MEGQEHGADRQEENRAKSHVPVSEIVGGYSSGQPSPTPLKVWQVSALSAFCPEGSSYVDTGSGVGQLGPVPSGAHRSLGRVCQAAHAGERPSGTRV